MRRSEGARVWGAVLLLMLVALFNVMDRLLPSILVEPIKHDLRLSDTAIGLINGFGFLVVYAVLGVPIARVSDRGRYGVVISACLTIWSAMTGLGGLVQNGWQLAVTRMGVALGEAGSSPAAHAFISRSFPPDRRGAPLAVLTLSVPFASMLSLMVGGLLGAALGWRKTLLAMGAFGLALAPVVYLTLGRRGRPAGGSQGTAPSYWDALRLLRKPSFALILAATGCVGAGGYTIATFMPAFLMRVHGMSMSQVGVQFGIAVGCVGIVSLLLTGLGADRLATRDPRWILGVVVLMIVLVLPFSYAAFLVRDQRLALVFVALANIIPTAYQAPVVAALQRLTPLGQRATASAILLFFTAMAGGLGPLLTGMISDALHASMGPRALGPGMLVAPAFHTVAAILYLLALLSFRQDMVDD
jgi:predicted MFS family arabinose efflux permease